MVRDAWVSAAIILAAATENVGASTVLEDSYPQAWIRAPPSPVKDAAPGKPPTHANKPATGAEKAKRGPEWFWSFRPAVPE
jgi:hypothetical protein